METPYQISNRFREVIFNGTWVANTNFKTLLIDLTHIEASKKIKSLNTIALLTCHINYYIEGVLNVFEGNTLDIKDKYSFDFPLMESKEQWETLLSSLWLNAENFANHIEKMSPEELNSIFVNKKHGTYRRNIEGMIEHCYYHLGQISLIKKMVLES